MARIRTIKPEFPQSESMGRISRDARLLFLMLFTMVDDDGRARAAPRMLASLLYPYDEDANTHIVQWLFELEREGVVRLYSIENNAYLQIEKWLTHQKIDKPSKSRLPEPPAKALEASPKPREGSPPYLVSSILDLVPSIKDQPGKPGRVCADDPEFEEFWKAYKPPPNASKPDARKAWAQTAGTRPPQSELLRAVGGYKSWLDEETRKRKSEFPKQHAATWLRNEVWGGFLSAADTVLDPVVLADLRDKVDRQLRRGNYAENYQ